MTAYLYKKQLVILTIWPLLLYVVLYVFFGKPGSHVVIGNMNGIEVTIPKKFIEFRPKYAGESAWEPVSNPPERTYKSSIDSFSLVVKWPTMQARDDNNNEASYRTKDEIDGAKDWISIQVQSNYENLSPEQIVKQIEYKKTHRKSGITGIANGSLEPMHPSFRPGNSMQQQGVDKSLGLNYAKLVGSDAEKPSLSNVISYWDGDIDGQVSTFIECPGGKLIPRLEPMKLCTQYYELPEFNAEVTVYYYIQLLPDWKKIEASSRELVMSLAKTDSK